MDKTLKMMEEITNANGPCGYEFEIKETVKRYFEDCTDEILYDRIGGIYGKKVGDPDGPTVVLAAHMDEVGFMIRKISDDGFLHFIMTGDILDQNVMDQQVIVQNRKGQTFPGIIAAQQPLHVIRTDEQRKRMIPKDEMVIDIGAESREQVEQEFGLSIGDFMFVDTKFFQMGNPYRLCARNWDDRVAVCMMLSVLNELKNSEHPNIVIGAGTVMEEIGCIGAKVVGNVTKPDVAIVMETGIASDTPAWPGWNRIEALGKGPSMLVKDIRTQYTYTFRNLVTDTAEEMGIPLQLTFMEGATDAKYIHPSGKGVPTVCINTPVRYIHSYHGIIDRRDFDQAVQLIVGVIKKLNWDTVKSLLP